MFPQQVLDQIDKSTPKFNPEIVNGLAVVHLKQVETFIDDIFRSVATGFPQGMKYLGCRRCTPMEEFKEISKKKINRCVVDVATSNVYLMRYDFSYNDIPLPPKFLFLPYVAVGGTLFIGGSRFVISPVISDRIFSIEMTKIFVRLLKAKLTFNSLDYHLFINDNRETVKVIWSDVYNEKKGGSKPKKTVNAECTLVHYLFCKYGFTETFQKFTGCSPVVGRGEINKETYPSSDWVICYSSQIKPRGYGRSQYSPTQIRIAVPRHLFTTTVKNFICGFFYIADHFPTRITPEYINFPKLWMVLLGHLIWSGTISEGKLISDVEDHIRSLDEYIEVIISAKLRDIGLNIKDIYELFVLIMDKFSDWLMDADDKVSTMYDKELSILYYVCYEIISAINKLYFKLIAAQKKDINENKIKTILNQNIKAGLIYKITKNHGAVTTSSTSGNNMALRITLLLVPQTSSNNSSSKRERVSVDDPAKRLHVSIAEVGGYSNIPKNEPTGRSRINPCLRTTEAGLILRDEKFRILLDNIQQHFKR